MWSCSDNGYNLLFVLRLIHVNVFCDNALYLVRWIVEKIWINIKKMLNFQIFSNLSPWKRKNNKNIKIYS